MNFVKIALYFAAILLILSLIFEQLIPLSGTAFYNVSGEDPQPYKYKYTADTISVSTDDILAAGMRMGFSLASIDKSPIVFVPGNKNLLESILDAVTRCPHEITMEQYCNASDLLGFYDLSNGTVIGTARYPIISPYNGFYLNITLADPNDYILPYPPSADASMHVSYTSTKMDVKGYYRPEVISHEPGSYCDWFSCTEGMVVKVKKTFITTFQWFGNRFTLTDDRKVVEFFFGHHDGCAYQTNDNVYVVHCKDSSGRYYVKEVRMVFRNDDWDSRWPPEFSRWAWLKSGEISIRGYHGNDTRLLIDCSTYYACYPYIQKDERCFGFRGKAIVPLDNHGRWNWQKQVVFPIFYRGDAFVNASCDLYLIDRVNTGFFSVERTCPLGSFYYYFRPPYCEGTTCILDPLEIFQADFRKAPEHAKKPYTCSNLSKVAAEELVIRALAEAIKAKTEPKIQNVLDNALKDKQWDLYFNNLDRESAKRLLQYFYLAQIPLNIKNNESLNYSKLEAIIKQEANKSTIYSLTTLFENTTRQYTAMTSCALKQNWNKSIPCVASFIQLEAESFGKTLYNSPCGKYFVAELVEIRKPSIADASKYVSFPKRMCFVRGYSPSPGIEYEQSEKCEFS
jgi:hypothetical protein